MGGQRNAWPGIREGCGVQRRGRLAAEQVPLSVLRRSSGASGAERGAPCRLASHEVGSGISKCFVPPRPRFIGSRGMPACCPWISSGWGDSPGDRPPRVPACGFILPRPASSSEFLRSSSRPSWLGLCLIRVFEPSSRPDRKRPLTARASNPRYVPSPGFRNPSTVFSASGFAGPPAATPRVLSARPGDRISQPLDTSPCSISRAIPAPRRILCLVRPSLSPGRPEYLPELQRHPSAASAIRGASPVGRRREGLARLNGAGRSPCVPRPDPSTRVMPYERGEMTWRISGDF